MADAAREVLPGIALGRPDVILSPAYWRWRCAVAEEAGHGYAGRDATLHEELGFCILGGYGVRLEVNEAFFRHLRAQGVFACGAVPSEAALVAMLSAPVPVVSPGGVRPQRYRFPYQRASRLARALTLADMLVPDRTAHEADPRAFRDRLCEMPGIGPKTASWITRNWLGTDAVAILDVHLIRLGRHLRLFPHDVRLPRDYARLEARFLSFAQVLGVRPSVLDAVIWDDMRRFGSRMVARAAIQ